MCDNVRNAIDGKGIVATSGAWKGILLLYSERRG